MVYQADAMLEQILAVEGPEGLLAVGELAAARFGLAAFEAAIETGESRQVLARVGERLPPAAEGGAGVAECDGVWAFAFGAEGCGGVLRLRLRGPLVDAGAVAALEAFARQLRPVLLRLAESARLREYERRIAVLADEALRADRLKEEFLANLSHELRTPLTAILGFAELLAAHRDVPRPAAECASRIQQNGERLLGLLNRLLQLAKLEADRLPVSFTLVNPEPLLREALGRAAPLAAAKGLPLLWEPPEELPPVYLDTRLFNEAVACVLENALKFTDRGRVVVAATFDGANLYVDVRDTGRGIDASHLPFVFDAFWQGDGSLTRAVGGNGIGLTLAQRLTARMGGDLRIDSAPGEGTAVRLRFPHDPSRRQLRPPRGKAAPVSQFGLPFDA